MKKILNFFARIFGKIGAAFKAVKNKIFRRQAEQERRQKISLWLIAAIAGVIIIALAGWYAANKFWPQTAAEDGSAAAIAKAKITIISSRSCGKKCWDAQLFIDALTQQNIEVVSAKTVYAGGWWPFGQAKTLVKQFQISKVPTVIVEFTGDNQPDISNFFSSALGNVIDGKFVLTKILAPYYDLTEKKLKGLIKVTYLTDNSCKECYDVKKHETALKNLGASAPDSETIDVASEAGQALVSKYGITKVPTMLISGEVSEYAILTQAWTADVGIISSDGTYIFTNTDLMGDYYRNLTTGKIIKAKTTTTGVSN